MLTWKTVESLKLDIQDFDLYAVESGDHTLSRTAVVRSEEEFLPTDRSQP